MATGKSKVIVELYDLTLTDREDDRYGRIVTTGALTEDDLVNIAVERRTDLNATTMKAAMDILKEIAVEQVANGASVQFGLGYFRLQVNGVFVGDNAPWDSSKHNLSVQVTPVAALRDAIQETSVDVRGMAASGLVINSVTDVASGEVNARVTPGGALNIAGNKIKIAGDAAAVGLFLVKQDSGEAIRVPASSIAINEPSKITCIVPQALPNVDYKLRIATQFSSNKTLLKEPRSFEFDSILTAKN